MPFNPCGRLVDFARREYKTTARLFRNSDQEVEIQWYRVPEDAPSLGFPSAVMSLDWTDNGYDEPWLTEVGEVWGAARPYSFHGELVAPNYDHVCGTEGDHARGAVFDPDADVQYDEQGLPLCCGQPAVPFMGVEVGFDAEVPASVILGASCAAATDAELDVPLLVTVPAGASGWARYPVSGVVPFALRVDADPGIDGNVWQGSDCGGLAGPFSYDWSGGLCQFATGFTGPFVWVEFVNGGGTDLTFLLTASLDTCGF